MDDRSVENLTRYAAQRLTRRDFAKRTAIFGIAIPVLGSLLAACGSDDSEDTPAASAPTQPATGSGGGDEATATSGTTAEPTAAGTDATATESTTDADGDMQLVIAQTADLQALYPGVYSSRQSANIMLQMYEGVVLRDDDMTFVPGLAESWERVDELTWQFNLRKGVTYHNGKPLVADDVKLSYEEVVIHPETGARRSLANSIDKVEVVDDHTVHVITKYPYSPLLTKVVNLEILNAETYAEVGVEGVSTQPNGTGPFRFVEWKQGERVVLEPNPDYWGGPPALSSLVFVPIPENATRSAAVESGTVQIAAEMPAQFAATSREGVEIAEATGTRVFYVGLNVSMEPFTDVKVRQALNFGVNVPEIVDALLGGKAEVLRGPLFQKVFGYSPDIEGFHYDPDKAKQLLDEAGLGEGFDTTLDVSPTFKEIAEAIAGQLAEINVRIAVNVMENEALYNKYEQGGSEMYLSSWGTSEMDADTTYSTQFLSTRNTVYTTYSREDLDDLIMKAAGEVDEQARLDFYKLATEIIVEDAPWIFLYTPVEIYAVRSNVQNWNARSDSRFNLMETKVEKA